MSSPLQQQINEMEPRRYARAARKAAVLANELAKRAGTEVSEQIRHLVDSTEEQIAAERTKELVSRRRGDPPPSRPGGGNVPGGGVHPRVFSGGLNPAWLPEKGGISALGDWPSMAGILGDIPMPQSDFAGTISGAMTTNVVGDISGVTGILSQPTVPALSLDGIYSRMESQAAQSLQGIRTTSWVGTGLTHVLSGIVIRSDESRAPEGVDSQDDADGPPEVEIGQTVHAVDQTWTAGRHSDGNLFVSVRGQKPRTIELAQSDVVRVDTSRGLIAIVSKLPPGGLVHAGHPQLMVLHVDSDIPPEGTIRVVGIGNEQMGITILRPATWSDVKAYERG